MKLIAEMNFSSSKITKMCHPATQLCLLANQYFTFRNVHSVVSDHVELMEHSDTVHHLF